MKKLTLPPRVFHYLDQPVRTALIDGEAWFVAKDVCQVLGIANSRRRLDGFIESFLGRRS
jgi:prophage antirepressor-like protein